MYPFQCSKSRARYGIFLQMLGATMITFFSDAHLRFLKSNRFKILNSKISNCFFYYIQDCCRWVCFVNIIIVIIRLFQCNYYCLLTVLNQVQVKVRMLWKPNELTWAHILATPVDLCIIFQCKMYLICENKLVYFFHILKFPCNVQPSCTPPNLFNHHVLHPTYSTIMYSTQLIQPSCTPPN